MSPFTTMRSTVDVAGRRDPDGYRYMEMVNITSYFPEYLVWGANQGLLNFYNQKK